MHMPGSRLGNYRTRLTFSDSVRKNLAAVEKNNEKIAQNHIAVFQHVSPTFLHAYKPFFCS